MKRTVNAIVIHCAATPNGKTYRIAALDVAHQMRGFKRDSQARRNFNPELRGIGYHFVIEVDGSIQTGRGLEEIGAHVQGSNAKSVGICMVGTDKFTQAQWQALRVCLMQLASQMFGKVIPDVAAALKSFKDAGVSIKGHRDYSPDLNGNGKIERNEWIKICPGFDVDAWMNGGCEALDAHSV